MDFLKGLIAFAIALLLTVVLVAMFDPNGYAFSVRVDGTWHDYSLVLRQRQEKR